MYNKNVFYRIMKLCQLPVAKMHYIIKNGKDLKPMADKGRFKGLMEKLPVYVILNDKAALLGTAVEAFRLSLE